MQSSRLAAGAPSRWSSLSRRAHSRTEERHRATSRPSRGVRPSLAPLLPHRVRCPLALPHSLILQRYASGHLRLGHVRLFLTHTVSLVALFMIPSRFSLARSLFTFFFSLFLHCS